MRCSTGASNASNLSFPKEVYENILVNQSVDRLTAAVDARASMVLEDPELGRQTVDVWRKSGRQFAGGGAGLFWPLGDGARLGGVLAEATLRFMFPDAGFAVSPSVGYAYGF